MLKIRRQSRGSELRCRIIERGLALRGGRRAAEGQLPAGLHGSRGIVARQLRDARGELLGLRDRELAVHQRQRLRRDGGAFAARATRRGVRRVEDLQHRQRQRPLHLQIDAAAVVLGRIGIGGPEIRQARGQDLFPGQRRNHADAAHLQVQTCRRRRGWCRAANRASSRRRGMRLRK